VLGTAHGCRSDAKQASVFVRFFKGAPACFDKSPAQIYNGSQRQGSVNE